MYFEYAAAYLQFCLNEWNTCFFSCLMLRFIFIYLNYKPVGYIINNDSLLQ